MFLLQNEQWFPVTSFRTLDRSFFPDRIENPDHRTVTSELEQTRSDRIEPAIPPSFVRVVRIKTNPNPKP